MATLKWSNVTGANTDAGSDSLKNAGSLFSKAFENFSGAVEGRKKRATQANTDSVLNQLRGITSESDFAAREGEFDLNALSQQAGGDIDTTAISKALAGKRPELRAEETRVRNELIGQIPNQVLSANLPGTQDGLGYKAQIASITQQVRDAGGTATDVKNAVQAAEVSLAQQAKLSPQAQVAVTQKNQELDILNNAAQGRAKEELDATLAANPVSHTLNAEGNATSLQDVYAKARTDYPKSSWLAGAGGDALTGVIKDFQLNGITKNGSIGIKVGDAFKEGTSKVEPWMFSMAMDLTGQTYGDAWGNATVGKTAFKETLAQLAFDPKYKAFAANAANAKREFARRSTELQLSRLKEGANFTKNIQSSESAKLLEQLQREAK